MKAIFKYRLHTVKVKSLIFKNCTCGKDVLQFAKNCFARKIIIATHPLHERAALRRASASQNPRIFAMIAEGSVITESLGLDKDARQAEI